MVYNGNIYQIDNLTLTDHGWYLCCLIYYIKEPNTQYDYENDKNARENENDAATRLQFLDAKRVCSSSYLSIRPLPSNNDTLITIQTLNELSKIKENIKWEAILISIVLTILLLLLALVFIVFYKNWRKKYKIPIGGKYFKEVVGFH